jgi:hypothetical protein
MYNFCQKITSKLTNIVCSKAKFWITIFPSSILLSIRAFNLVNRFSGVQSGPFREAQKSEKTSKKLTCYMVFEFDQPRESFMFNSDWFVVPVSQFLFNT